MSNMVVLRSHLTGELINSSKHPDVNFVFRDKQDFIYYRRHNENSEVGGRIYCVYEKLVRFGVKFFVTIPTPLRSKSLSTDFIVNSHFDFKELKMADELGYKRAMVWNYLIEDYMDYEIDEDEKVQIRLALIDLIKDNSPVDN